MSPSATFLLVNAAAAALLAASSMVSAQYSAAYTPSPTGLPQKTENGQTGTNRCGTESSPTSECQNAYLNSVTDFCLWGPPNGGAIADTERIEVAYCTKAGRGTRLFPPGTITGAHFVKTPHYVQITVTGDFTKIGIPSGDEGGELDPHGADGNGNPVGSLVFSNAFGQGLVQMHEWMSFMSATDACFRACSDGNLATTYCPHIYDELGCAWNMPVNNDSPGQFENCEGDDAQQIGVYEVNGKKSTFYQSQTLLGTPVPPAHPAPSSSNCKNLPSVELGAPPPSAPPPSSSLDTLSPPPPP
ncbi:hypothetical protein IE53DRAFT_364980 [Violaceomyces palustris]|uniref:Uncharacterized protein n=1 Tax=Violaceomyces palustris TaxID=1673888 RepID=A0ACD0NMK6_9BASI|nr:hypothetical protein IE53DRAFT_364980 [Violaceomyces palustris]